MAGGMAFCMIAVLGPQPDGAHHTFAHDASSSGCDDPRKEAVRLLNPPSFFCAWQPTLPYGTPLGNRVVGYIIPCPSAAASSLPGFMASVVVTVCFCGLLRDVCQKYLLPAPRHGIPVENDRLISVYVEVEIPRVFVGERRELMGNIEKCSKMLRRPSIHGVGPTSNEGGLSDEDPATPSGYRV
uniref:Uncharacterized protein n=1 Tax=Ananas comosus var. bracteatus TaxID=296719 RepID=A0A6V7PPP8_ANACO|nr:unnamed protein product [Ananas comosus var. bracteatus]